MKLPKVKDCCCFSLRTGCLIIAAAELLYSMLKLFDSSRAAFELFVRHADDPDAAKEYADTTGTAQILQSGQMYFWFHIAALVTNLICSSLLLHGVRTKNRSFFIPWLGGHFLVTVVFWGIAIVVSLASFTTIGTQHDELGFAAACVCLLAFVFVGYLFTVVYSYYKQLEQEARAGRLYAPFEVQVCVPPAVEDLPPAYEDVMKVNIEVKGEPLLQNPV